MATTFTIFAIAVVVGAIAVYALVAVNTRKG